MKARISRQCNVDNSRAEQARKAYFIKTSIYFHSKRILKGVQSTTIKTPTTLKAQFLNALLGLGSGRSALGILGTGGGLWWHAQGTAAEPAPRGDVSAAT